MSIARFSFSLIAVLAVAAPAGAADSHGGHQHGAAPASSVAKPAAPAKASGLVRRINAADGTLTITHSPIPALNMGAMTMPFKAQDKALLEGIAPMQRIEFEVIQQGNDYIVTSIRKFADAKN